MKRRNYRQDIGPTQSEDDILEVSSVDDDATRRSRTMNLPNEDAFSSDSDEDEHAFHDDFPVSEFDKALRTGVPNRGAASFEDGDFYREAEDSLVKEVLTTEESFEISPPRSTRMQVQKPSGYPPPTYVDHHGAGWPLSRLAWRVSQAAQ